MPLVGDIIMSAREQIPDMPQTAPPPVIAGINILPQGGLAAGNWYLVMTLLTEWGESAPGPETVVTLTANNQQIAVVWNTVDGAFIGLFGARVYYGTVSGQQRQYVETRGAFGTQADPIIIPGGGTFGSPPVNASSYLPDTSGKFISNYTMYRWLNEGLNILSRKTGGILDASGVPTTIGRSLYQLPFKWIQLNKIWFDGWELIKGTRSDIFYRNAITAISNLTVTLLQSQDSVLEVFPQPNRTAGQSTITSVLDPGSNSATLDQTTGWVLPFGLAVIYGGGAPGFEVVGYSSLSSNTMSGITRALGGTTAQSWPAGAQTNELNLRFSGYRMAANYNVGDASLVAAIPDGWSDILSIYMDSKALSVQGDKSGSSKKLEEFLKLGQELASASKLLQGPVQIGLASTNEVYNPGLGGGWYLQ